MRIGHDRYEDVCIGSQGIIAVMRDDFFFFFFNEVHAIFGRQHTRLSAELCLRDDDPA